MTNMELLRRGETLCKEGRFEESIPVFDNAVKSDAGDAAAYFFKGYALASLERYPQALELFQTGARLLPVYAETAVEEFMVQPLLLYQWLQPAMDSYLKTVKITKDFRGLYLTCGWIKIAFNDHEKAVPDFDEALRLDPANAEAWFLRGKTKITLMDPVGAVEDLTKAIELRPEFAYAYARRGIAFLAMANPKEAVPDFRKAAELDSNLIPWLKQVFTDFVNMVKNTHA